MCTDRILIRSYPGKLGIGEVEMDGLVTDRMDRNRVAALLRFGNRMMPLDARFERALAKPAA